MPPAPDSLGTEETLQADLLNTSAAIYHRRVAQIQLEAQRLIEVYREKYAIGGEHYVRTHPGVNAEQVREGVARSIKEYVVSVRVAAGRLIDREAMERRQRDAAIRAYTLPDLSRTA